VIPKTGLGGDLSRKKEPRTETRLKPLKKTVSKGEKSAPIILGRGGHLICAEHGSDFHKEGRSEEAAVKRAARSGLCFLNLQETGLACESTKGPSSKNVRTGVIGNPRDRVSRVKGEGKEKLHVLKNGKALLSQRETNRLRGRLER